MLPPSTPERYTPSRFPAAILSHGVWQYFHCSVSDHDVEERLFALGMTVTSEAIRQ